VVTRVLIGDFGAIFRAGLADLLVEAGCHVLPDDGGRRDILERVVASRPGVVVLDLDTPGSEDLARSLSMAFPGVTVIACSSAAVRMRVYPPFHSGESYVTHLSPDQLVQASTGTGPQAKERRCPPT